MNDAKQTPNRSLYKRIARKIESFNNRITRDCRVFFGIQIELKYKDFSILLPADHMLPVYRRTHPQYDKFLPYLAKYIKPEECIVDVGANVGDSLAGMIETNPESTYICIEPDDLFFELLKKNIERIKKSKATISVLAAKYLVGRSVSDVQLEGSSGTKHAVVGNSGPIRSRSLDSILSALGNGKVKLLKSDVDGFDYDVIDSASSTIAGQKPLLFFECQTDHDYQKKGYEATFHSLESVGYTDWVLFDNFGAVLMRAKSAHEVTALLDYIWNQKIGLSTRTIYYMDILSGVSADKNLIDAALAEYS
jgi:FkbM family methyltransferase